MATAWFKIIQSNSCITSE